ncbi:MAG: phage major capsid protein [Burkholderiales bacterium]|nr:phage major capsid protein [Burkholderiales bacterium]
MNAAPHLRGLTAARFAKALAIARGDLPAAHAYAESQNWRNTPDVAKALKAAVTAVSTEEGAALLRDVGFDFAEFLRPQTIVGRLTGLRRVPFNVKMLAQVGGTSANWVGEASPKPVTAASFDTDALPLAKVAAIAVITEELARSSAPSAESVLSRDLGAAGAQALDRAFIDPANSGVSGVKPAAVTHGAPQFPSTGATADAIDDDLAALIQTLTDAGSDLTFAAWIMRPQTAVYLSRLRSGGALAYPGITVKGGTLLGLPVIVSGNVPTSDESGNASSITLVDAAQVAIADDGDSALSVAAHASLQMDSDPETGAQQLVSLWQRNLIALRVERAVNWKRRHANVAAVLTGVTF